MILFVVDQVAGAEYIFPLLDKWKRQGDQEWKVIASSVSANLLRKRSIDCEEIDSVTSSVVENIFSKVRPNKVVLSSTGGSQLEELFLFRAKEKGIPSISFIDTWVNYAKRFEYTSSQNERNRFYPEMIFTIDEKAKNEMIAEDIPEELIKVVGQPFYEYCLSSAEGKRQIPVKESVLFLTQPVSRYYDARLGYDEKSFIKSSLDIWERLNRDWSKLYILVHPAEDMESYRELIIPYSSNICILRGDECDLRAYSLVVGMFSSMMIQSILAGINTVSFQPGACGKDLNFFSRHGYMRRFTTVDDFYQFLRNYAGSIDRDLNMENELKKILKNSCLRFERCILD